MIAVPQDVEGRHIELESRRDREISLDPGGCNGAEDVAVRERDHPPALSRGGHQVDEFLSSGRDQGGRFASRRTVSIELPLRIRATNFCARQSFVLAVIDLPEQRRDMRIVEARKLRGAQRTLHGTRKHGIEADHAELDAKGLRPLFSALGERKVSAAGVASRKAPFSFAVPCEVELERRRQAGLPIISGRPVFRERLALSITAPARTRCPGRTHTRPTAACPPWGLSDSLTADSTRFAA